MPNKIKSDQTELSNEIVQHISIREDGSIEIPWITPKATILILSIWKNFNSKEAFPITLIEGNHIYCG